MPNYLVFQRNAHDRKAFKDSGYPWTALLVAPIWALRQGLTLHGVVLVVLYALCALLMGAGNNGIIVGATIALWLGVFSAHNATDWLSRSLAKRDYGMTARVEASSVEQALQGRNEKRHRLLLQNISPLQLREMLTSASSRQMNEMVPVAIRETSGEK